MKVAVASDHGGYPMKQTVLEAVIEAGHEPLDLGVDSSEVSVDYPDYAEKVGQAIQRGEAQRGIILCGSGVGACIAANKMKGIFAGLCHDTYSARQGVEHDDMNVLCLGARIVGPELIRELILAFLKAQFSGEERFIRRRSKVLKLESR